MTIKPRFSLVPLYLFQNITDIKPGFLNQLGIKFLMLDLDNTIAAYDEVVLSDGMFKWISEIKSNGTELYIISNSKRTERVKTHSDSIEVEFITQSGKPSPKNLLEIMEKKGFKKEECALAGDQVFTDGLAANRAGIISIVVKPRRFTNPFLALRYYLEIPFRIFCKNKIGV